MSSVEMPEPLTSMTRSAEYRDAFEQFEQRFPAYAGTVQLDCLRAIEFARLDAAQHVYLDYTGAALYPDSLVRRHKDLLLNSVFGNPHSENPTSLAATDLVEQTRRRILQFFNASPDEYAIAFTPNASGALKLVGEAYPFSSGDQFLLTFDNHNSVNGIREYDRTRGADTTYIPVRLPDLRVDEANIDSYFDLASRGKNHLFAYPAQSNFSGVQHPLEWIARAQEKGWDVLLDAAAYVPTNRFDLGVWKPDYVALSFYKIFGYPTGVGALIAKRSALEKLHRPWFAGGTISVASVQADRHSLAAGATAFEDGTPNYLAVPAIEYGLELLETVGINVIRDRVRALTGWLIEELLAIRHPNGNPVARVYGPANTEMRGGTITFNFYAPDGEIIDHRIVEKIAGAENISLRTGCFCNPGAGETALGITKRELDTCFRQHDGHVTLDDFRQCIDGKGTGAVRISLGMASNFTDAYRFIEFVKKFSV